MAMLTDYVNTVFTVFLVMVFIRILLSWIPSAPTGRVTIAVWKFFHESTEWYLRPFRRVVPTIGMFDFSPIIALIVLYLANGLVVRVLQTL